jgi:hypothetical protein
LVEQRIENPRVGGSIPPQATSQINGLDDILQDTFSPRALALGKKKGPTWSAPIAAVKRVSKLRRAQ